MKKKFNVSGMSCSACSAAVERATHRVDGVESADVNLIGKFMICEYDETKTNEKAICAAVKKAGYKASVAASDDEKSAPTQDGDGFTPVKTRLIVSAVFLVVLMYFSMGHMIGLPLPPVFHGTAGAGMFAFLQLILTLPIIYVNRKFFAVGFKALAHLSPNMDSLVAVGSAAALGYGIFSIFMILYGLGAGKSDVVDAYRENLYFESAAMILTLVTVGKFLEERSKNKTTSAISSLVKLAPETATVIRDGKEEIIPSKDIRVGDIVLIKPGERIPVDGTVVEGASSVDQSALTGESVPIYKTVGDSVISASVNKNGTLKFRAEKVGSDTTLSKIIELVENAGASKAPVAKLADKVAAVFVPVVMGVALVTGAVWLILGYGFEHALNCAISVLVISCPCALGLATPVAITVAAGRCASMGIMIKSAEAFEILSKCDAAVLDKTGTVTCGEPRVTDVIPIDISKDEFLKIAASLEKMSEHPLAEAICAAYDGEIIAADGFSAVPGRGVTATLGGVKYYGGSAAYMTDLGIDISPYSDALEKLSSEGKTAMMFADGQKLIGIIGAMDEPRETSAEAIAELKNLGVEPIMLTGDSRRCADAVAKSVGIDTVISDVLPTEKEKEISSLRSSGKRVVMVGDGINDSPALAAADVGVAVGSGTDIAIDSADVVLMQSDLRLAATAIGFSRRTLRVIRGNLFWAFVYNVIGIPIAAGVLFPAFGLLLSPMIGAAAMSLSSLFVVTNSLRLYRK